MRLRFSKDRMDSRNQSVNQLAVGSLACGLLSPFVFASFVIIGALQELGYSIFDKSYRYQTMARVLMLILSVAAVLLGYRAKFQIAISNGSYRGMTMASLGRILGYVWGTVMLLAILLWGV